MPGPPTPSRRFDIALDGKTVTVELEDLPDGTVKALLDGRVRIVDARPLGGGAWSLLERPPSPPDKGAEHEGAGDAPVARARLVQVDGPLGKLTVEVGHPDGEPRTLTLEVSTARPRGTEAAVRGRDAGGPVTLRAPIPGKIVKIAVKPGERVKAGQSLLVLEAMKMENEVRSPHDATVLSLLVAEGASVDAGQDLVALGPSEAGEPSPR